MVNCFQAALKFKTLHEWYYDVKADGANPHILSCVIGIINKQLIVSLTFSIISTIIKTGGWKHITSDVAAIGL